MRFAIGDTDFLLDGEPHRILSGAIHYFRVHPDLWADRIRKAKLMGLNTIETYVAWNAHAPSPDVFDLSGGLDLGRFLDLVAAEGMHAIVRPGPYICAEWSNGGLPYWLFADGSVGVRCNEPGFLAAVETYLQHLAPVLVPRQIDHGGPIVLVQVENEYGAYGSDPAYLRALEQMHRDIGLTVPFTSVDQPMGTMLEDGSLPSLHKTGSFGSRSTERLARLRQAQPTGPLMCSEFWDGWFDSWGEHHHTTPAAASASDLDDLLAAGGSVNIYMFHGGTNFGFTNGANDKGVYRPIATSYDYDAPLDEAGRPTEKFHAFRSVIERYAPVPPLPASMQPGGSGRLAAGAADGTGVEARVAPATDLAVRLDRVASLRSLLPALASWSAQDEPPTFDALGAASGFVVYRAEVDLPTGGVLTVGTEVRDRAVVSVDGAVVGVLEREHHDRAIVLPAVTGTLELLVEDQGRVDYGPRIGEPKGLVGGVAVDGVPLARWTAAPLALDPIAPAALAALAETAPTGGDVLAGPTFAAGSFDLDGVDDRYLSLDGFRKGVAWVNGFCLGRYWSRGPQQTLAIPGPVLREGRNELVVLELHAAASRTACLLPEPALGHTEA
ncbi:MULTISPECIES: beta-galactosidase family protein [unclassified Curtobacterium]|uniref:glycoside hydrolase family 35 protein n=1 Tax=unclassified Curtobacterium TaxID=257496 RepID=UPI0008DCE9D3|nr:MULTISPECIES: beta-galactosidase family protein [unclassified Curtobacterium]OIH92989.1 beta-galactosidase [Curtobacterium sp. MCBA15_003]OII29902.1 beta-galactosidase [Curtobacterium sp. MMLR14_006]